MTDDPEEQLEAAVVMRFMAAIVRKAGGEVIVSERDLISATFERLGLELLPDGSARLFLQPDAGTSGAAQ